MIRSLASETAELIPVVKENVLPVFSNSRLTARRTSSISSFNSESSGPTASSKSPSAVLNFSVNFPLPTRIAPLLGGVGGGYANVLNSNVVTQYYIMPSVGGYSSFLNQYGIWGDQNNSTAYNVVFPVPLSTTGTYTITVAGSGNVSVAANGTLIASSTSTNPTACTYSFTAQSNPWNLGIAASSSGSTTSGVAVTITDPNGNLVFDTIHPLNYVNGANTGSGISTETVLPLGGAWFTGVTKLKLGQSASSSANFYVGSTITVTSKYVYQVNQSATYVPPPPAPSGGGGGGCCVVATVMTSSGNMSESHYKHLNSWAVKVLDKNWFGERLHRGYHIIAPKVAIPLLKTKAKGYVNWSFKNATNMLMKKEFSLISIPNSLFWITLMGITGVFVSKEQAEKSWNNLYK